MFNMLKQATQVAEEQVVASDHAFTTLTALAESSNQSFIVLAENVNDVLAHLAQTVANGEEIKMMHYNSVAAFLAGVDKLSSALPDGNDASKRSTALRVLAAINMDPSGHVTQSAAPVVQLGAKDEQLMQKYQKLVADYTQSHSRGQADGRVLTNAIRQVQANVDNAMRKAEGSGGQARDSEARGETTYSSKNSAPQVHM